MSKLYHIIKNPQRSLSYLVGRIPTSRQELGNFARFVYYRSTRPDYIKFYSTLQNEKVSRGMAYERDGVGVGQFEFLKRKGLKPHNRLLDIGCGDLRGGIHAIKFLEPNNYSGMDISEQAITEAREIVDDKSLSDKSPTLIVNDDLSFEEFEREEFDYIIAQSVFTHLPKRKVQECFRNIRKIMDEDTLFYFTYSEDEEYRFTPSMTIENSYSATYPYEMLQRIASKNGLAITRVDYPEHPGEMDMAEISLK